MIDESVVTGLRDDIKFEVQKALATLSASNVILAQIGLEQQRLLSGSTEEPVENLTAKIKLHRLHVAYLQELHDLGLKYSKELS